MSQMLIELTFREIHGIRATLLEAVTDQILDAEPDLLAQANRLRSGLFDDPYAGGRDENESRVVHIDILSCAIVDRSLAHAIATIEVWELPIRVGLTREEIDDLRRRIAALRAGHQ